VARALVVVNPAAGSGRTAARWPGIRDDLTRRGLVFEWAATAAPGDGTRLARDAVTVGTPLVVAVGGDGTLNEVVNGVTDGAGRGRAAVAAVLTGRGRDAAANLGLARDLPEATRRVVEGAPAPVDLGVIEWPDGGRRYFVGVAGAGFDAAVARRVTAGGGTGTIPYVRGLLGALLAHRPLPVSVTLDAEAPWTGDVTTVVVANAPAFGGGMRIAPGADPRDGVLDVIVVGTLGRLELLRWFPRVYRGTHLAHPRVRAHRARRVVIAGGRPLPTQADGEPGPDTPCALGICAGALHLVR
jgi:YegS/Rv2252/BmrU family lipid kinase